jgi:UDP-3-O-[3-hydroxymyristoyl] glucosamine N-acyltransferase
LFNYEHLDELGEKMSNNTIYKNAKIGNNSEIEDYCVVGHKLRDGTQPALVIGSNALIRSNSVIYSGNKIGNNVQMGHGILIRENCVIGNNVSIGSHSVIENNVSIEDDVRIHSNCFIPQYTVIKKGAWIGPGVNMVNDPHPPLAKDMIGPIIGENAKIGAGVIILDHLAIGENSLIGAGTIVTKNVEKNTILRNIMEYKTSNIRDLKDNPYGIKKND